MNPEEAGDARPYTNKGVFDGLRRHGVDRSGRGLLADYVRRIARGAIARSMFTECGIVDGATVLGGRSVDRDDFGQASFFRFGFPFVNLS